MACGGARHDSKRLHDPSEDQQRSSSDAPRRQWCSRETTRKARTVPYTGDMPPARDDDETTRVTELVTS
uniref:Uncharacterized protein n=1 Tax=Angiostrongylus cantonensis TaxID=6313 RepID=A0A0K0DDI8_ANGCA